MSKYISRGSEWRKWDLHVHTKDTMKNDQFTSADFDAFCVIMFKKAIEKDIAAIGITDYFNICNYRKVRGFVDNIDTNSAFTDEEKEKVKSIFILPNVELRMLPVTSRGRLINIHCLFNPEYVESLENNFFGSLTHSAPGSSHKMNRQGIIDLGKLGSKKNINDTSAYKKGIGNFVITPNQLHNLLNKEHNLKENTLIVVSNSSADGVSGLQAHYTLFEENSGNLDSIRSGIYKMANAIFSGNESDREYFLGKKQGSDKDTIIQKIGSLKPCIHGSDAHTEDELFNPDHDRYCWIKSDLTFEGLKQILYEPEDRVKIQGTKPDERESYHIIDSVKFVDEKFMQDEILVNQNLTTIIGGKSTGKSLLLKSIAETIDPDEVRNRLNEIGQQNTETANRFTVDDFEVTWKDQQQNTKSGSGAVGDKYEGEDEDTNHAANKKIIYIPQSYLNRLVEEKEDASGIHTIIENVLKQNSGDVYANLAEFERITKQQIATAIVRLFNLVERHKEQAEELRDVGDRLGVEMEIKKLEEEAAELKRTSGMSQGDISQYDNLVTSIQNLENKIVELKTRQYQLNQLKEIELFFDIDLSETGDKIQKFYNKLKNKTQSKWNKFINEKYENLTSDLASENTKLEKRKTKFEPLLTKATNRNLLNAKIRQIETQQQIQKSIQEKEILRKRTLLKVRKIIQQLVELNDSFYVKYENGREEIFKQNAISDSLEFDLKTLHKTHSFQENFIQEVFDNRKLPSDLVEYEYADNAGFSRLLDCLIRRILNGKITIKTKYTQQDALTILLQNWYKYDYSITQDGDEISQMSPGKKSFILLKLLIELDNSKCPILLDQPEDDLDNRSIYDDLVVFINRKKKERQIIIVTHNPNLAVGADAECVIVANQKGAHSDNKEYRFEYVSGALEDTFPANNKKYVLHNRGIQEHVCDILEGGNEAFMKREQKYGMIGKH